MTTTVRRSYLIRLCLLTALTAGFLAASACFNSTILAVPAVLCAVISLVYMIRHRRRDPKAASRRAFAKSERTAMGPLQEASVVLGVAFALGFALLIAHGFYESGFLMLLGIAYWVFGFVYWIPKLVHSSRLVRRHDGIW